MDNKIVLITLLGCLIQINLSLGQTFQRTYGGINDDAAISFTSSYNGTLALLCQETDSTNSWMNILKVDSSGNIIWKKKIKSPIETFYGISISATPDSGFIIASNYNIASGGSFTNLLLLKLNHNGDTTWTKSYSCTNGLFGLPFTRGEIIATSDGGYAFTGTSNSLKMFFLKTDSIGNPMWFKYYDTNPTGGCSIKQDSDGNYVLCGSCGPGHYKILLIKINSLGDTLFTRILDKGYPGIIACSMDFTNNKGYIIAGYGGIIGSNVQHGSIINLDSSANISWVKSYPSLIISSVRTIANGYLMVCSDTDYTRQDIYLMKTDSVGNIIWIKSYGGAAADGGISIHAVPDYIYILGMTRNFSHGLYDVYLLKADSNGYTSCNEDSITNVTTSSFPMTTGSGCIIDSGYIMPNSLLTVDTSTYQIYDDCICIPPVSFFHNNDSVCCNIGFTDYSTWADSWHWDFGDGDTSNLENVSHQFSSIGTYYVCLTVTNSCGVDTYCDSVMVVSVGIKEESKKSLILFPNPSDGSFQIIVNSNVIDGLITMTNIVGVVVYSEKFNGDRKMLNCNLNSGIYFVQVSDNNNTWRKKIIIE